jgi:hypothetical protein
MGELIGILHATFALELVRDRTGALCRDERVRRLLPCETLFFPAAK